MASDRSRPGQGSSAIPVKTGVGAGVEWSHCKSSFSCDLKLAGSNRNGDSHNHR
jgi:hypothetical protein